MNVNSRQDGYTLIEMVIVIVIIGILAAIAVRSIGRTVDTIRTEETKAEMKRLAYAITGNPDLVSGGTRTDYGYIGDVGSLPPNWTALVTNPGYATWSGPYITDDGISDGSDYEFTLDAWGAPYSPPGSNTFSSTGGPETITRCLANSVAELLYNDIVLSVEDIDDSPPKNMNDSVRVLLAYPDGLGGMTARTATPDANGLARFDSIPMGLHALRIIYLPENDTLVRRIAVNPGRTAYIDMHHYSDVW